MSLLAESFAISLSQSMGLMSVLAYDIFYCFLACGVRKAENRFTDNRVLGKNRVFNHLH